ncbi:MAG: hypothetical protein IJ789_09130 [Bacteroidales bacterium]|nr:hypothetical protein [Bacteroidales bacterium]
MLRNFHTNTVMQMAAIVVITAALWIPAFVTPVPMPETGSYSPIFDLLHTWLSPLPRLASSIALIVVVASAILFNIILADTHIIPNNTLLPTLLYIVAMSVNPHGQTLTPMVIVDFVLVICTHLLLLRGALLTIPPEKTFGIMALVGMCTLVYMPTYSLIISFMLVVIIYRLYNWRDWVVMILGFLAPYIAFATYLFITDNLVETWQEMITEASRLNIEVDSSNTAANITNSYIIAVTLISLLGSLAVANERPVVYQKNMTAISLLMVAGIIIMCYSRIFPVDMQMLALPFALQATLFFLHQTRSRRPWIWDIVFILTLIAAIVYNFIR